MTTATTATTINQAREKQLLKSYNYQCSNCSIKLTRFDCDFDHKIPHFYGDLYGGAHVDDMNNFRPLCLICHQKKTLAERQELARLVATKICGN